MMFHAIIIAAFLAPQAMSPQNAVELKYKKFLIRQVRFLWGMDQKVSIFAAQIRQESNWNPQAKSPHAAGLSQFTPATAKWIVSVYPELKTGLSSAGDSRSDWKWSIRAMVRYDRYLYIRVGKMVPRKTEGGVWVLTLRAYNGGLGWIKKELAVCRLLDMRCCLAFRRNSACRENLSYANLIIKKWQPLYAGWDI